MTITCPLCASTRSTLFDQRSFRQTLVSNRECLECGLVYQSPHMSDQELEAFYEEEYRQVYQGSQGPNPKDLAVQTGRAEALLAFTQKSIPEINAHLDIGCSAGLLLERFQQAYTCQSVGVEPGTAYRNYSQARGLTVFASLGELQGGLSSQAAATRFDLISLAHVLEHIPDPKTYLANLRQEWLSDSTQPPGCTQPPGWLLVEVPNLYGHDSFEIAHLVSYSPHTLDQMLQQAGFQIIARQVHGQPRSELIPLYITVLAQARQNENPLQSHVIPERGVKRKRRAALLRRSLVTRLAPHKAWLPFPVVLNRPSETQ